MSRKKSFKQAVTRETYLKPRALPEEQDCPYCGERVDRVFVCPGCAREGCPECIPAGNGCVCPGCEGEGELSPS